MKRGGGSRKGSAFEREICKQLSLWWSGKEDDLFWRTHSSGARATQRAKQGKKTRGQYGDLCAIDGRGKALLKAFTFSLKRGYKDVTLHDVMDALESGREPTLATWIREVEEQSVMADSLGWLLIAQRTRRKPLVFMPVYIKQKLGRKQLDKVKPRIEIIAKIGEKRIMSIFCAPLDSFLRIVDKQAIKAMLRSSNV